MIIQGVALKGTRVVDASIIKQNLAIWIDANNSSSYGGSGTSITDLSGNSRTQNLTNAGQFTTLSGIKCFDCSSSGLGITAASAGPTLLTSGFTYIAWARMIASTATFRTLFRTSPDDHPILINAGTNDLGMWDNSSTFHSAGYNVSSLANTWTQWVVTGDSSGQTFYINGQQVGTTTYSSAGNNHNITGNVGGAPGSTQPFGYIANMLLYTTKLTQEQIQQNYYYYKSLFGV
jgi:Concanavalin A-like lectin/glucanases superfamily